MRTETPELPRSLEQILLELTGYYELLGLDRPRAEASARADFAEELGGSAGLARAA